MVPISTINARHTQPSTYGIKRNMTGVSLSEPNETQEGCHEGCHEEDSLEVEDSFTVVLPPPERQRLKENELKQNEFHVSKARKRRSGHHALPRILLQDLPHFHYLNRNHTIQPQERWNKMKRYKSFIWNDTKYERGDFVLVENEVTILQQKQGCQRLGAKNYWIGLIQEIRASCAHDAFVRIFWMYWPEELPSTTQYGKAVVEGRLPCHGTKELIVSNHMDIIDARSVAKHVRLNYWNGTAMRTLPKTLYWRQLLDVQVNRLVDICMR